MAVLVVEKAKVQNNLTRLQQICGTSLVMPIIKANGYGLGTEWLVLTLAGMGVKQFVCARLEDALLIRNLLPEAKIILVTCYEDPASAETICSMNITPAVGSEQGLRVFSRAAAQKGTSLPVHLKLDTGMGRFGFLCEKSQDIQIIYNSFTKHDNIQLEGTFTHFSRCFGGKKNEKATLSQFDLFLKTVEALKNMGLNPGFLHTANSVATLTLPQTRLDGVRVGSALTGRCYSAQESGLEKVGRMEGELLCLRVLPKGHAIGYGGVYQTKQETKIAVVDAGNADGFSLRRDQDGFRGSDYAIQVKHLLNRFLQNKPMTCSVNGRTAPILGRVSLCSLMVGVDGIDCKPGDRAVFEANPIFCGGTEKRYE